jgi:hypothetical protein
MRTGLFLAVLWFAAGAALGDGCFIPAAAVRKIPEIPAQRAILSWKDGIETLVISSALDSESQQLGWIIPLPAVPTVMEKADPGSLKTLNFCVQPLLTHDLWLGIKGVSILLGVLILVVVTFLFRRKRLLALLVLLMILLILGSLLLGLFLTASLSAGGGFHPTTVRVEKTVQVGAYVVTVVQATRATDLGDWLKQNGFAELPGAAGPIVESYIRDRWVFAAVKLTRDEAGQNSPHPLKLVFPSAKAVYPMKLTALAGGKPMIELFVVADQQATLAELPTEFSDRFALTTYSWGRSNVPYFVADTTGIKIGHPEVVPLLWNGCVLTKLSGRIAPADMTRDFDLAWQAPQPHRQHFFTTPGAMQAALLVFVVLGGGFALVSVIVYRNRLRQDGGRWFYFARRLLPGLALMAVVSVVVFSFLPKVGWADIQVRHKSSWRSQTHVLAGNILEFSRNHSDLAAKSEAEIGSAICEWLADPNNAHSARWGLNPILGGKVRIESTPGNLTVRKKDGQVIVTIYDFIGRPLAIEVSARLTDDAQ